METLREYMMMTVDIDTHLSCSQPLSKKSGFFCKITVVRVRTFD